MMQARRLIVLFAAAAIIFAVLAAWLERTEAVDQTARAIPWGSGPEQPRAPAPSGMVLIQGGKYLLGDESADAAPDAPLHHVRLKPFYMDRHEVTNRDFARFAAATGHVTTAERTGGGWIFRGGDRDWTYVRGADWRHPLGPGSSIESAMDHPVVMVSWHDAEAYAVWAGKRLPTEAEWEAAARGGSGTAQVQHRREKTPDVDASANVWQGKWPQKNTLLDGYFYTAPVGSFPPNSLGLYDMIGNVWEWTADWYAADSYRAPGTMNNPAGPESGTLKVAKGGSWFCSASYCSGFRPGFRGKSPLERAFNNVGFRCARDARQ